MFTLHFFNRSSYFVLMIFISFVHIVKQMSCQSCEESTLTLEKVSSCPRNLTEWLVASEKKNCSSFNQTCVDKDRFVYHCALNEFLNETIDVCAPERVLFEGFCAEYNTLASRIQENYQADCKNFTTPCPDFYPSTDAYKYQECYTHAFPTTTVASDISEESTLSMYSNSTRKTTARAQEKVDDGWTILGKFACFSAINMLLLLLFLSVNSIIFGKGKGKDKEGNGGGEQIEPFLGVVSSNEEQRELNSGIE